MGCGLPIICTESSGINDIVSKENGFVIETGNKQQLKEKLEWFLNNRNQILKMSENSKIVSNKYSWDYYRENIKRVIQVILDK